jgi:lysophospholipase L1-like esterase
VGLPAVGWWKLDDGSGATARDSAGTAPATATGGVSWSTDHGGSVTLNGTGSLATASAAVGNTNSYAVSAWVKLGATGTAAQTVVSQDGAQNSTFALQYIGTSANRWAFTVFTGTGAISARVQSNNAVQTATWTHLFGSYNAASGAAELYVNGDYQGFAGVPAPTAAPGPFVIGRGKASGAATAFLTGSVSDVRIYERGGNGWDAKILFKGGPASAPTPGLGAPTVTDANRTLDRIALNQAQLRTVIVALGANDILAGRSASSIEAELTELLHQDPKSPSGIRNGRRTDGTRVHVIVTTVPPLGLADTDPREQQRRQLNADILVHYLDYGAHERIDFAARVQDPAHPNQINPAYLTGGAPNTTYHDAIAQAITDAATRFPPEAQL